MSIFKSRYRIVIFREKDYYYYVQKKLFNLFWITMTDPKHSSAYFGDSSIERLEQALKEYLKQKNAKKITVMKNIEVSDGSLSITKEKNGELSLT